MTAKEIVFEKVMERMLLSAPITETSNLYTDLGFDSLSFAALLTDIEECFLISFNIDEMEACLQIDRLIATVINKLKEIDMSYD